MERRLSQIVLDALPSTVLVVNKDYEIVLSNASARELFDLPIEHINGRELSSVLPDSRLVDLVTDVLREGGSRTTQLHYAPGGESPLAMQATVTALRTETDGQPRCLVRLEIVSDAAVARDRLDLAEKRAEELRLLVWGMAHELGNLLSISHTTLHYLGNQHVAADEPTTKRALGVLNDSVDQMDGLLRSLSGFAFHQKVAFKSLDIVHLVRKTTGLLESSAEEQGVTIVHEFADDLPLYQGNPNTLRALLLNLIKNAIEAMGQGGEVRVRVHQVAGSGGADASKAIRIEVSDTGVGINEVAMSGLFKLQASGKNGGHGLGLWLCRRAVEEHGGEVSVVSDPGHGTTFIVTLPVDGERGMP